MSSYAFRGQATLRGCIHCHSTRSDGKIDPADVVDVYRSAGYDFLSITDHFDMTTVTDTREFSTEDFTTIPGAELHAPSIGVGVDWDIVAVGLPVDFPQAGPAETGPELAKRATDTGAFVFAAHPAAYGVTPQDIETLTSIHAIEVYNEKCERGFDKGSSWYLSDHLSSSGRLLRAVAGDDAHFGARPDCLKAWLEVERCERSARAIVDSLKAGAFYATQGPRIEHIELRDRRLTVECSEVAAIIVTGSGWAMKRAQKDSLVGELFELDQFESSFVRVTLVDAQGLRAWSNPLPLEA